MEEFLSMLYSMNPAAAPQLCSHKRNNAEQCYDMLSALPCKKQAKKVVSVERYDTNSSVCRDHSKVLLPVQRVFFHSINTTMDIDRPSVEERNQRYKPGSIKRVKLKNFLTYDAVEFFPGPR